MPGAHEPGDAVRFQGSDAHKISAVLRLREGDSIEVIDSRAQRFLASIQNAGRSVDAVLERRLEPVAASGFAITVAQGVPKGQRMDFAVEKLTELGVEAIVPLRSERTIVTVGANKLERWRRLARVAAQQCGRDRIPEITQPVGCEELIARFDQYDCVLFVWELARDAASAQPLPMLVAHARRILAIVGPEGGFSHAEAQAAQSAGAHLVSLGSRILRTETAGLALVSVLNYLSENA